MKTFDFLLRQTRAAVRLAERRTGAFLALPDRRDTAAAGASGAVLFRKPSRRMVAELSNLLAVAPIVFALSFLAANPWSQRITAPAPRHSIDEPLASPAAPEVETLSERGMQVAKISDRATGKETVSPRNPLLFPGALVEGSLQPEARGIDGASDHVAVAEDGHLIIEGRKFRLAGIVMPNAEAACWRLDGVQVRCIDRVVARLTILTQHYGDVSCSAIVEASGERLAKCLAGKIDLADDLVRTRLARRS